LKTLRFWQNFSIYAAHAPENKNRVSKHPANRRGEKVEEVQRNRSGGEAPSAFLGEETVEAPIQKNRTTEADQRD
jgi:hypothetical protein